MLRDLHKSNTNTCTKHFALAEKSGLPQLLDDLPADSRRTIRRMAGGRRPSSVLRRLGLTFEAVRCHLELGEDAAAFWGSGDPAGGGCKRGRGSKSCVGPAPRRRTGFESMRRRDLEGGAGHGVDGAPLAGDES